MCGSGGQDEGVQLEGLAQRPRRSCRWFYDKGLLEYSQLAISQRPQPYLPKGPRGEEKLPKGVIH